MLIRRIDTLMTMVKATWLRPGGSVIPDTFPSMRSLLANVGEKDNYVFEICTSWDSPIKLFAPHGGCIEPGTGPIVKELAAGRYDYYVFRGVRRGGGCRKLLHVTSTHYDEERCQSMARSALFSLSVHGCRGRKRRIEIGGGNRKLVADLYETLRQDYPAAIASEGRDGTNPLNFVNLSGYQGVQLELSEGFRQHLFLGYPASMTGNPESLPEFIITIRNWLRKVESTFAV